MVQHFGRLPEDEEVLEEELQAEVPPGFAEDVQELLRLGYLHHFGIDSWWTKHDPLGYVLGTRPRWVDYLPL